MMKRREIERRVKSFPSWHYQFDLDGVLTPIFDLPHVNRHEERRRYFFAPLVAACGGSLHGRRVLDLGCNAGYWALAAIEEGCDYVCGIDARQVHIEQAEFVFKVKDIPPERYRFVKEDVMGFDVKKFGMFDIVLCLGLFYHVSRPVELLDRISQVNTDILILDTALHAGETALLQLRYDDPVDPRNAVGSTATLVFYPTQRAVIEMVRSVGYSGVVLEPDFYSYAGAEDFESGRRRAFFCSKTGPVDLPNVKTSCSF